VRQLENKDEMEQDEIEEAEKFCSILSKRFVRDKDYVHHNKKVDPPTKKKVEPPTK
jgi:hypothetical protein